MGRAHLFASLSPRAELKFSSVLFTPPSLFPQEKISLTITHHPAARRRVGDAFRARELGLGCSAAPFSHPAPSSRGPARARNLFVEMQQPQANAGGGHDWLADLPDDALRRVLFFMPAREAVQTSVLAWSWRHRWKSMPALRIHVGHVRDEDISLWIQKASMLKPQILIVDYRENLSPEICIMPLIPRDLSTLELKSLDLRDKLLDFSRCPALKNLLLRFCFIGLTENISSQSLEHLTIMYCTFPSDARTHISAPSLISLELSENYGNTPFIESMPSLGNACVSLHDCEDRCHQEEYGILCSDNGCSKCGANVDGNKDCVLLEGLSKVKSLELVALTGVMPVNWVESEEIYNPHEQIFPSKKPKVAEVVYEEFDKRVEAISRILKAYGMYLQHIQQTKAPSERLSDDAPAPLGRKVWPAFLARAKDKLRHKLPFVGPVGKEHRCLLVAEEDNAVFLLAVDKGSSVQYRIELVCIRGVSAVMPEYNYVLSAVGPNSAFRTSLTMSMLCSSVPNEVDLGNAPYKGNVMSLGWQLLHREFKEICLRFSILRK
ncbi:hypothetical protein ACQ4PT_001654 [Festuca glaucescens]